MTRTLKRSKSQSSTSKGKATLPSERKTYDTLSACCKAPLRLFAPATAGGAFIAWLCPSCARYYPPNGPTSGEE
jgi:hypothetical protein